MWATPEGGSAADKRSQIKEIRKGQKGGVVWVGYNKYKSPNFKALVMIK